MISSGSHIVFVAGVTCLTIAFWGCQATQTAEQTVDLQRESSVSDSWDRVTGMDHGLEVRKWAIHESSQRIGPALSEFVDDWSPGEAVRRRLERSGFRFVRVPIERIDEVFRSAGVTDFNLIGWHGQMLRWTQIAQSSIPAQGSAIAIDGIVRRFDSGSMRLMARSWTLPTESGLHMLLQLVPVNDAPAWETNGFSPPNLSSVDAHDEVLLSMWLELQLDGGYAYVLTCESPDVEWGAHETGASTEGQSANGQTVAANRQDAAGLGPDVAAPHTIGELLLRSASGVPTRGVLVFVPRIPAAMQPEVQPAQSTADSRRDQTDHG